MYWVLESDLRVEGMASVMDVPDELDLRDYMLGKVAPKIEAPLRLMLSAASGEFRGDIIGPVVTLFSDELIEMLTNYGVDNIDYTPVELIHSITQEVEFGYSLANILGLIRCVDNYDMDAPPLQRPTSLEHFTINAESVRGCPIFRLAESPRLIVIENALRDYLVAQKVVGVRMRKTEDYEVW
ncbi:imm11 family protein [Teredinibacter waterburyi]|uniref:imm11 family protein n=1 Tax=Teredinibacter waterburyi TaxID=1500538 RepID=UPI00165F201F|nr:DUF1629 domain-containing protein [Teredinibacter waterburyi]